MKQLFFIKKSGLFYRQNSTGYTASVYEAGLYSKEEAECHAEGLEDVSIHPVRDVFKKASSVDEAIERLLKIKRQLKDAEEESTGTYSVSFSIDGWRANLSRDLDDLRGYIEQVNSDQADYVDVKDDIVNTVNSLICSSNSFNCVHIPTVEGFSKMGNVEINLLD